MTTKLTDAELSKLAGGNPKVVTYLRQQQQQITTNTATVADNVAATDTINEATVVTLSGNTAFDNERVLAVGDGLTITDQGPGLEIVLDTKYPIVTVGGFTLSLTLSADTSLTLPTSGTLLTTAYLSDGPYASDSAAAAGGVPINGVYRKTGGTVAWRVT